MTPDPENVQSLAIARYPHRYRVILLFRIDAAARAQTFLRRWAGNVQGGPTPAADAEAAYHFAFSWAGMAQLLGVDAHAADRLDPDAGAGQMEGFFTDPAEAPHRLATAVDLGFSGANSPEHWWAPGVDPDAFHMAMFCYFSDEAQKTETLRRIRHEASGAGLHEWQFPSFADKALSGHIPSDGVLHFGFRDGVSKVEIDWDEAGARGKTDFRELLLGYSNLTYPTMPVDPGPWNAFLRDGYYVGTAWLYQDVAAFNHFLADSAAAVQHLPAGSDRQEWLAAKLVGRWRDGSPLAAHPDRQPDAPDLANDFGYGDDETGEKTPLFSHIRVCNTRDQELSAPNRQRFRNGPPRLVRRGFSYGPPLAGSVDDGRDRGLVGIFACARINEQLYTIIRWMQETGFSDRFYDVKQGWRRQDSMFGLRDKPKAFASAHIPLADGTALDLPLRDFIRYKGLSLFFAPSLASLKILAGDPGPA